MQNTSLELDDVCDPNHIAIVGISCALPSGTYGEHNLDYSSLWDFLINKGEAYEDIPQERFNIKSWHGRNLGQIKTTKGAFLKESTSFDHLEFGVPFKDAIAMSPSTRRLIELSFLSLLDAGIDYRGRKVGCFMAGTNPGLLDQDEYDQHGSFTSAPAMIANRVSYALDITGPSVALDTACSSTMTALHLAIQSILVSDCEAAIVGGCQYNHNILDWINYSQGGVLAPDGKCKPFDAGGDGFSRGEGAAVVVLKRLCDARRDNDYVYATILGSAINSTGSGAAANVPVGTSQKDCIQLAFSRAHKSPTDVDYVELHATGTAVGDPIEANAAGQMFHRDHEVIVGSIKGNIGHLEITAFLASLLKVCLILDKGLIPPQVNLTKQNHDILWDAYGLTLPTTPKALPCHSSAGKALASISSFGIGGANGHVVIESVIRQEDRGLQPEPGPALILAGGLSPRSAAAVASTLAEVLTKEPGDAAILAAIAARRARQMTWRTYAVFRSQARLDFQEVVRVPRHKPFLVFVISGQGPQYAEMGRHLYRSLPTFRDSINALDATYRAVTGNSLLETAGLFGSSMSVATQLSDVWPISVTLPAIAMFQIALIDTLRSVGVIPDAVLGHSAGETTLLYASGAASKDMVMELAIARGRAMSLVERESGTMAALACSPTEVAALITEIGDGHGTLDIACHNSPGDVAVSGSRLAIDKLVTLATTRNVWARTLRTNVPVHSSMMETCHTEYERTVGGAFAGHQGAYNPIVETYSTLTGERFLGPFTPQYFWDNARKPVLFTEAVSHIHEVHPDSVFIEISPHPVLSQYIATICGHQMSSLIPSRRPAKGSTLTEHDTFLDCLGQLSLLGCNTLDIGGLKGGVHRKQVEKLLPPYPFSARHVPFHAESPAFFARQRNIRGPLNQDHLRINAQTHPDLAQHVIQGEPIMPAAGFLEMAFEFGARCIWDVQFKSALSLTSERPTTVKVALDGSQWTVKSLSAMRTADKAGSEGALAERLHAEGRLSYDDPTEKDRLDIETAERRCTVVDLKYFYASLDTFSKFGPSFRRIEKLYQGNDELIAHIRGSTEMDISRTGYRFDPAVLDSCFQAAFVFLQSENSNVYYLPSRVGSASISSTLIDQGLPEMIVAHIRFVSWRPDAAIFDILVVAPDGGWLCSLDSFEMARHRRTIREGPERRFELHWQPLYVPRMTSEGGESSYSPGDGLPISTLYALLDNLASQTIIATLRTRPDVGPQLDRQRYFQFALDVSSRKTLDDVHVANDDLEILRSTWPVQLEVTERLARVHGKLLLSSKLAVEALYEDDIMTKLYSQLSDLIPMCEASAVAFRNILSHCVEAGKKVIRVLEIGTGTGLLTSYLEPILTEFPSVVIEYVASDISVSFASLAAQRFTYPHLHYQAFDISRDPTPQGLAEGSFDIVTGLHVLHAAPMMQEALNGIAHLLVVGGQLLFVELNGSSWPSTPGALWHDFIFGAFSEWFSFEDTEIRSHCSMPVASWKAVLQSVGFETVQVCGGSDSGLHFMAQAQKVRGKKMVPKEALENVHIAPYSVGEEKLLQEKLSALPSDNIFLWLISASGVDGDALLGLSRSLTREYPNWIVHAAIFGNTSSEEQQETMLRVHLPSLQLEPEVFFDRNGMPHVSRIVPSSAPSRVRAFRLNEPWIRDGDRLFQTHLPQPRKNEVIVNVASWTGAVGRLRAFVGHVVDSGGTTFSCQESVLGLTSQRESNFIAVYSGALARVCLDDVLQEDYRTLAEVVFAACLVSLATSPWMFSRRSSGISRRVLLLNDSVLHNVALDEVFRYYEWTPVRDNARAEVASAHPPDPTNAHFDLILGSCSEVSKLEARRTAPSYQKVFKWDHEEVGFEAMLQADQWLPGGILEHVLEQLDLLQLARTACSGTAHDCMTLPLDGTPIPYPQTLFNPRKSYILIGGIGGLGVHIAAWMYEHGARNLILTSRSGRESVVRLQEPVVTRVLEYLETLHDLNLRLEACDATCKQRMRALIHTVKPPLAGAMLMPLVLRDRMFTAQTEASFQEVHASKCEAFRSLAHNVDLDVLDFCITFSSVAGLLGNGGQTNYASACTMMDAMTAPFAKAFTLIVPGITDVGRLARDLRDDPRAASHLATWGLTCEDLCDCIEEGIQKLSDGPFTYYIPDIDWVAVGKSMGVSLSFQHLAIAPRQELALKDEVSGSKTLLETVRDFLRVSSEDFARNVPLTQYGLDSLAATRLSAVLRPFGSLSQLQLLGDMTLEDIERRFAEAISDDEDPNIEGELVAPVQSILEENIVILRDLGSPPLIVIHGGDGSIRPFHMLAEKFDSSVWAVQITPETPLTSVEDIAEFYLRQIRARQPCGPYRLAAFSLSSLIGIQLAKLIEASGEKVVQLALLDHFPTVVFSAGEDLRDVLTAEGKFKAEYVPIFIQSITDLLRRDTRLDGAEMLCQELVKLLAGEVVPKYVHDFRDRVLHSMALVILFALRSSDNVVLGAFSSDAFFSALSGLEAPVSLYVASGGMAMNLPERLKELVNDFGIRKCYPDARVYEIVGEHWSMLATDEVARLLQTEWLDAISMRT